MKKQTAATRRIAALSAPMPASRRKARADDDGIVQLAALAPGQADQHGRAGLCVLDQRIECALAGLDGRRLEHQILGRIAQEEHFGEDDKVGATDAAVGNRGARRESKEVNGGGSAKERQPGHSAVTVGILLCPGLN